MRRSRARGERGKVRREREGEKTRERWARREEEEVR